MYFQEGNEPVVVKLSPFKETNGHTDFKNSSQKKHPSVKNSLTKHKELRTKTHMPGPPQTASGHSWGLVRAGGWHNRQPQQLAIRRGGYHWRTWQTTIPAISLRDEEIGLEKWRFKGGMV